MKEYLKLYQPRFYNLLQREFSSGKIPHSFLLVGDNADIPLKYLAMSIICNQTLACESCEDCKRVKEGLYPDIITFDGSKESIKKPNIQAIQKEFKKSSVEGKGKIYILKNIEFSNKEAMNSLLKILEEPVEGVYAIFTTKNKNKILPTIISRCQVIELSNQTSSSLATELNDTDFDLQTINILSKICNSREEAIDLKDEKFDYLVTQVINFIEDLFTKRDNLIINTQINLLKDYNSKEDIKLFLNVLVLGLKDMFHVKHNNDVVFIKQKELFSSFDIEINDIIKKIELTLETINSLETNANIPLLMDSYMYRL